MKMDKKSGIISHLMYWCRWYTSCHGGSWCIKRIVVSWRRENLQINRSARRISWWKRHNRSRKHPNLEKIEDGRNKGKLLLLLLRYLLVSRKVVVANINRNDNRRTTIMYSVSRFLTYRVCGIQNWKKGCFHIFIFKIERDIYCLLVWCNA